MPRRRGDGGSAERTDEGDGLLVEDAAGQQVEVVLHRVHHHRVARVVPALRTTTLVIALALCPRGFSLNTAHP